MNRKRFFSRQIVYNILWFKWGSRFSCFVEFRRRFSSLTAGSGYIPGFLQSCGCQKSDLFQFLLPRVRFLSNGGEAELGKWNCSSKSYSNDCEEDGAMNEFLSRFVWIMRRKLCKLFPDHDKQTLDGMLLVIVGKVLNEMEKCEAERTHSSAMAAGWEDLSEDLWRSAWEACNSVLENMKKETKKEKIKGFLHSSEVKEMCSFAVEIGVRGDMLREMRFKWAHEEMEKSEFYERLERLRGQERAFAEKEAKIRSTEIMNEETETSNTQNLTDENKVDILSLPKRHGKIPYKIHGLDLSDPKWAEVVDNIRKTGLVNWPQEPKPIYGRCKLVMEKILSLNEEDDPSQLLAEWVELLSPSRADWIDLLDKLKNQNYNLYMKIAEVVLGESSFRASTRDYLMLINAHAQADRMEDGERIFKKMKADGIKPDILTLAVLVKMYSKAGELDRARESFESLRSFGFQPNAEVYVSMIMAYVRAGQPKLGESLMREMEAKDVKLNEEIYVALLRAYSQRGDVTGAERMATTMQFAGLQPTLESCALLIEAHGQAGDPEMARSNFDYIMRTGQRPDDRCVSSMIAVYAKKNLLDKALSLLMQLEQDGLELGVRTSAVLVDWLGKLQLIEEAEQLLGKMACHADAPPFSIHVSLCDMYARAGMEKKALQTLGIIEAKKEKLGRVEFERVINGLLVGGFLSDAKRVHKLMEAQGFVPSEQLKVALMASKAFVNKERREFSL